MLLFLDWEETNSDATGAFWSHCSLMIRRNHSSSNPIKKNTGIIKDFLSNYFTICLHLKMQYNNSTNVAIKPKILLTNNSILLTTEFNSGGDSASGCGSSNRYFW